MSVPSLMEQVSAQDLLDLMPHMSEEDKRLIDEVLTVGAPLWMPQVGPQAAAAESQADILFYGGSAGGGKTDLLCGLAVGHHEQSIIFRREAVQLIGIEERLTSIMGSRTGYNSQDAIWRLPPMAGLAPGRTLELGSVKEPGDWIKYQGRPHDLICVERGTPVLMGDSTYKSIESLRIGDLVATLEGPRPVSRLIQTRKSAVLAAALVNGRVVAAQIQSRSHEVLTPSGWASRDTTQDPDASSPTQRCGACRSEGSSSLTCERTSSVRASQCHPEAPQPALQPDRADRQSPWGSDAGEAGSAQGSGFAGFACRLSGAVRRLSATALQALARPWRRQSSPLPSGPSGARGAIGVRAATELPGSVAGCSSCTHHDGAPPLRAPVADQRCLLLRGDVAPPIPRGSGACDLGRTPTHSPRTGWFAHPYTKEIRRTEADFEEASLVFQDAGERDLFDLTVDGANHYITAGGFVNRNCFDEITHFLETQVRQLIGWLRTGKVGVRQRVVMAGNPPTDSDGEWVIRFFAPWLDPDHPNPAKPGELRWFVSDEDGKDLEVPNNRLVKVGRKWVQPKSRTFLPSAVKDNLFLATTGYESTLDALPEPFRSQMRDGNFMAGRMDEVNQVIPTAWIKAAQARWLPRPHDKGVMTAMGYDPARGGADRSALARRHGNWFDEVVSVPGKLTADGPAAAAFAIQHLRDGAPIPIDAIGIGSSALDFCQQANLNVWPIVASDGTTATDKTGQLRMRNLRALMYWRLREALDPNNDDAISLPPDDELKADLAAVRFKLITMGKQSAVLCLPKDDIREVLGRSPDKGDAVAMTFLDGLPAPGLVEAARSFRNRPRVTDWRCA